MKKKSKKYNKLSRRNRLKYATKEGYKAYRRGKESKLTRARKLLLGRNATGFAGRVGALGLAGAGVGTYKIGGNIVRSGKNLEKTTSSVANAAKNVEKATQNVTQSTASVNKGIQNTANLLPNAKKTVKGWKQKAANWIERKKKEGVEQRKNNLGFKSKQNNLSFMKRNNQYAEFSIDQLEEALEATLYEIEDQYEQGLLTEEEAEELEADALGEYEELGEELMDEYEDEDEEFEYAAYDGQLANFSAGTALGGTLMEHVVALDPYDPEGTIVDLADSLGLVDEEGYQLEGDDAIAGVLGLMSGEIVPDESLIESLSDYLELDEDEADEIYDLTAEELEAAGVFDDEDYDEEEYYDEDGDVVDELENEIDGLEEELDEVGGVAEEAFSRIANMEAQFAQAQEQSEIAREFEMLERDAYSLVESGQMPPAVFEDNYGTFSSREDQMAAFSQVCNSRNVDADAELYRLEGLNETYLQMEPNINFSQMSYADGDVSDFDADDAVVAQAARNVRARLSNNQFGQPLSWADQSQAAVRVPGTIPSQIEGQPNVPMSSLSNYAPANPRDLDLGGYARSF